MARATYPHLDKRSCFGPATAIVSGAVALLEWTLADGDGRPIFEVGLDLSAAVGWSGTIYLDWLDWSGTPKIVWSAPRGGWPASRRAWVDALYQLAGRHGSMYTLVANDGRGLAITGQREWADYRVSAIIRPHMAEEVGLSRPCPGPGALLRAAAAGRRPAAPLEAGAGVQWRNGGTGAGGTG